MFKTENAEINMDKIVCRYYAINNCYRGYDCLFPHVKGNNRSPDDICRRFLGNRCSYGEQCKFFHLSFDVLKQSVFRSKYSYGILPKILFRKGERSFNRTRAFSYAYLPSKNEQPNFKKDKVQLQSAKPGEDFAAYEQNIYDCRSLNCNSDWSSATNQLYPIRTTNSQQPRNVIGTEVPFASNPVEDQNAQTLGQFDYGMNTCYYQTPSREYTAATNYPPLVVDTIESTTVLGSEFHQDVAVNGPLMNPRTEIQYPYNSIHSQVPSYTPHATLWKMYPEKQPELTLQMQPVMYLTSNIPAEKYGAVNSTTDISWNTSCPSFETDCNFVSSDLTEQCHFHHGINFPCECMSRRERNRYAVPNGYVYNSNQISNKNFKSENRSEDYHRNSSICSDTGFENSDPQCRKQDQSPEKETAEADRKPMSSERLCENSSSDGNFIESNKVFFSKTMKGNSGKCSDIKFHIEGGGRNFVSGVHFVDEVEMMF